jgi:hypothetical protein
MSWEKYEWNKQVDIGKITYYYCNRNRSELPIRDVCSDHDAGHKTEPHYEGDSSRLATYNECAGCNAPSVNSMIEREKANFLFFATWYTGRKEKYRVPERRYFVTGYYKVDEIKKVGMPTRYAIKCYKPLFVRIEKAFEITKAILKEWRPHRRTWEIYGNQLKFYLNEKQTRELLNYFNGESIVSEYIAETKKVATECENRT